MSSSTADDVVTVVVVDDSDDLRLLLRMTLERDERFVLVGEAADGIQAVDVAGRTRPDLIVLDRQMPRMGGVEALPLIREVSPRSAVVLYTAAYDNDTCQAALSAGAAGVMEKLRTGADMADELAQALVDHWQKDADLAVHVGPVSARAAVVWIANSTRILAAVRAHPEILERPVDPEVLDDLEAFLHTWADVAAASEIFVWAARTTAREIERLVESWAVIDRIPDDRLESVGCSWSPPEGRPFFEALTAGVLEAVAAHDKTKRLAERLSQQWSVN